MPGSSSSGSTIGRSVRTSRNGQSESSSPVHPRIEYELNNGGVIVPSNPTVNAGPNFDLNTDDRGNIADEDDCGNSSEVDTAHGSSTLQGRSKRKQTFERRNIKRVRADVALSEEARFAQRAELIRRLRLQMEQGQVLQPGTGDGWSPMGKINSADATTMAPLSEASQVKTEAGEGIIKSSVKENNIALYPAVSTASEKLFKQKQHSSLQSGDTEETAIVLLGDSDDEIDLPISDDAIEVIENPVIELSDDEKSEEAENASKSGDDVQTEFCELRDAENLPDPEGRICIRRGATEAESFYLSPHIASIIKPHQVSGVRFLFDNLVENRTQFQRSSGFGCILAHSMGLGKSIQVIAFLDLIFRYYRPAAHTVLLIVPINTLQNWQAEFQLWLPSVLYTSKDDEKPNVNGHHLTAPLSASTVQSAPSLLSLINDSPPLDSQPLPLDSSDTNKVDINMCPGEPQFPPPPLSPQQTPLELPPKPPPFRLHVIKDTTKSLDARYQVVSEWANVGGVLLMGYEMFRLLTIPRKQSRVQPSSVSALGYCGAMPNCLPMSSSTSVLFSTASLDGERSSRRKKKRTITIDIEREEKEEHMLVDMRIALTDPGPQIVICDEGHRIKNSEASISKALKALRTRRRVVLTGYPLQNNLMEYWCMVDFVRPNYLGTKSEFTNMFQRPIENGQCVDSTEADRKLMQGRAHVLHELLSGFVQRRSHAVLKASLPPKQEVVLMVRMSPLQRRLYSALMNHITNASSIYGNGFPTANTLQTYALCCKIWNHPDILWRIVKENVDDMMDFEVDDASNILNSAQSQKTKRKVNGNNSVNSSVSGTNTATSLGGDDKYDWVTSDLWGAEFKPGDVHNSGKFLIFLSLLRESVFVGDKMLLFSQSLLTLDHLERILGQLPLNCEMLPPPPAESLEARRQRQEEEAEETEKSVHYRISRRLANDPNKQPQVWIRNVHYFRLDGSTSATDRDRLIQRFNDPSNPVKLFLVSTRAGSLGVNLVGANRVIVFDASWNPCHDCQAVCRVYRYGQEKPCYIYRLVSDNTMERKIYDRQVNKQGVSNRVVDEMNPGQQFTRAHVGVLVAYEDKDMPSLTTNDLQDISSITDDDPVLKAALERNKEWITTKPFTHESLLIDRKDYRLTRVEKRIARERYEHERMVSNSSAMYRSTAAAAALQYHQYMMMAAASGNNYASLYPYGNGALGFSSNQRGTPNILSKSNAGHLRQGYPAFSAPPYPMVTPAMEMNDAAARRYESVQRNQMLQKDLDEARIRAVSREIGIALPNGPLGSEYRITRVAATTDLVFPQSTHPPAPERSVSKGEVVEIIQAGSSGKYLRLPRTGDIYVVKPGSKENDSEESQPKSDQLPQAIQTSIPPPLCRICQHPASPNCLCSTRLYTQPAPASSSTSPSAVSYHPPTYTNQYAPTSSYGPATHGYQNY